MAKNTRWLHSMGVLKRCGDCDLTVPHPSTLSEWVDNMKLWPEVSYIDIVNYFVFSEGVDGEELRNYKSTEAYNYLYSNKIGKVLYKKHGDFIFLKAEVEPSQTVSRGKHQAWVMLRESGVVETVGCSCIAGLGKSCSHAAAVLWKVQNAVVSGKTGSTCTDEQRRWNAGTSKNLQPKRLCEINFRHHRAEETYECKDRAVESQSLPKTPHHRSHKEFKESVETAPTRPLFLLKNTLLEKCYSATPLKGQPCGQTNTVDKTTFVAHQTHSNDLICEKCKAFYQAYIEVTDEKATQIEFETREQSASDLWHSARKLRITASSAKKVPVHTTTKKDKFLCEHMYPTFRGNYATNYGKENELIACKQLKDQGMNISHRGTVISLQEPWLSASPDGVIDSSVLLEIKCPVPNKSHTSLIDQLTHKCSDLKLVDGKLQLQKTGSRGYYMQLQLAMFCTCLNTARLFIWTPNENVVLTVDFDEVYVQEHVQRLKGFYFSCMLPHLVDEFAGGRFTLNSRYVDIMRKV